MISTTQFFIWFFEGLQGLGGWLIFGIVSFLAALYVFISSSSRKMPATVFSVSALLLMLMVVPAAVYRFVTPETRATLTQYKEIIFYLGLIGGIVPIFVALGYTMRYHGMVVCEHGHVYAAELGECPECIATPPPPDITGHPEDSPTEFISGAAGSSGIGRRSSREKTGTEQAYPQYAADEPNTEPGGYAMDYENEIGGTELADSGREFIETQFGRVGLPMPSKKKKAQAFLLLPDNHTYQLNAGVNLVGRESDNDFVFLNEYVGRHHAKIVQEDENLFRLFDLGSTNGTWLNGKKVSHSVLLEPDDEIYFGKEAVVLFLATRRR